VVALGLGVLGSGGRRSVETGRLVFSFNKGGKELKERNPRVIAITTPPIKRSVSSCR